MNEELIKEIVKKVLDESILKNEFLYLLIFLILAINFVSTFFANYLGSYAQKRGENLATKTDLEDIKSRLKTTTEITEKIKNEMEHQTWRKQQIESLKREKLEQYLISIYAACENLHTEMKNNFFYENESFDVYAINKAEMFKSLYFPELNEEHSAFMLKYSEYKSWIAKGMEELLSKRKKGENKPVISTEHMNKHKELVNNLYLSTLKIEYKAEEIAKKLNI